MSRNQPGPNPADWAFHSSVRIRYNGKHGVYADQLNEINPQTLDYVWYVTTGQLLPKGIFLPRAPPLPSERLIHPFGFYQKLATETPPLDTNKVNVTFKNGAVVQVAYNTGLHP